MLNHIQNEALVAHKRARRKMEKYTSTWLPTFQTNNLVWLDARNIQPSYKMRKIAPQHKGPFWVLERLGPLIYHHDLPEHWKIHNVFNIALLKAYRTSKENGQRMMMPLGCNISPEPEVVAGVSIPEVIIAHRKRGMG